MTRSGPISPSPLVALAFVALMLSAAIHMRIGLKEIIEDYVHGGAPRWSPSCSPRSSPPASASPPLLAIVKISLGS